MALDVLVHSDFSFLLTLYLGGLAWTRTRTLLHEEITPAATCWCRQRYSYSYGYRYVGASPGGPSSCQEAFCHASGGFGCCALHWSVPGITSKHSTWIAPPPLCACISISSAEVLAGGIRCACFPLRSDWLSATIYVGDFKFEWITKWE